MQDRQKYGPISPFATEKAKPMPFTASEVVRAKSGRFVTLNAGYIEMADDGDTLLYGWVEAGEKTTVAGDLGNVIVANGCNEVFRIPINAGTLTQAMIGKTCDLVRSTVGGVTNIQGAKLDASGEDNLLIVGGDIANNEYVDVMFYQAKITGLTGVV